MGLREVLNRMGDQVWALPVASVVLTERCDSKCISCDYWQHGHARLSREELTQLAAELRQIGAKTVVLTGGEPLIHPHWTDFARAATERGLQVWLNTNGLRLKRDAEQVSRWIGQAFVSFDGATSETYAAIRGVDRLEQVLEGVREIKRRGVVVTLRTVLQQRNLPELVEIVQTAKSLGVHVSFLAADVSNSDAFMRQESWQRDLLPEPSELDALGDTIDAHRDLFDSGTVQGGAASLERIYAVYATALGWRQSPPPVRCNAPQYSIVVGASGELKPCHFLPPVDTWRRASLKDQVNSPAFQAVRAQQRTGQLEACTRCVCFQYWGFRALWRS